MARTGLGRGLDVLLGNGSGGFQHAFGSELSQGPVALAIGDFNGDKAPDVVAANYQAANVSVFLNDDSVVTHFVVTGPATNIAGQAVSLTVSAMNFQTAAPRC